MAQTEELPGFLWVGSQKLPKQVIETTKQAILKLSPLKNSEDASITKQWRKNIRYGAVDAYDYDYDVIRDMLEHITIPE